MIRKTENLSIPRVVKRLQHSGQTWSNITSFCGRLIALHKCHWQLLAWEYLNGHLTLLHATDEQLILHDGKGAYAVIKFLPPDQPNVGLSFHICPDGNHSHHFQATFDSIFKLCSRAAAAHLTEAEARQLLYQRLVPKLSYALHGTDFSSRQCGRIDSTIRATILPIMRFNRTYPGAVLYGPIDYGGMEFPNTQVLQDQVQIEYLIKQLRWDKTVANFLVTLDSVQLCSGYITPLFEDTTLPVTYLEPSYIIGLRSRLFTIDASLWIEKSWVPALQRDGDESLMAKFVTLPFITRAALRQANAVRLYLRVITIADLADVGGTFIPAHMLTGDWQAGSDIKWPFQPLPPPRFWRTFRSCLRQAYSTGTPATQPAS